MTRDELIETMALVLFNRMRTQRHMRPVDNIGANNTPECNECRAVATAALTAIEAAGMRVVPVEPTFKMLEEGDWADADGGAKDVYRAMLDAAQEDSASG